MPATQQDLPPPSGFPSTIRYKRYLPTRGPSGFVIFTASALVMGYGWYWMALANSEKRELRREKAWSRISIIPLLQAETDRDVVRRMDALKAREEQVMKNVPNWSAMDLSAPVVGIGKDGNYDPSSSEPVYHTKKYVAPTYVFLPEDQGNAMQSQWWRGSKMFTKNPCYHDRIDFTKENPIS